MPNCLVSFWMCAEPEGLGFNSQRNDLPMQMNAQADARKDMPRLDTMRDHNRLKW